jgi:hypothetical protein
MINKSFVSNHSGMIFAYALLKPAAVAARFMSAGTAFQGSPARTVKKLRRISSRPWFGRTLKG